MIRDLNLEAKKIVEGNEYLSLATADKEKGAWVSVVCYAYDNEGNFYFVSMKSARHCKNISENDSVCFAIYDSRQAWGAGYGLQIEGVCAPVNVAELSKATMTYFTRNYPYGRVSGFFAKGLKNLLKKKIYSFYKITPRKVWMNNPNADLDERVEVNLGS